LPAGKGNAADERFSAALSFGDIPDHPESSSGEESWMTKSFFETYFNTQINSWIPGQARNDNNKNPSSSMSRYPAAAILLDG